MNQQHAARCQFPLHAFTLVPNFAMHLVAEMWWQVDSRDQAADQGIAPGGHISDSSEWRSPGWHTCSDSQSCLNPFGGLQIS